MSSIYNLRPRPLLKPTIFRFLNEERFPTLTAAIDACPDCTNPAQSIEDSSFHPSISPSTTTETTLSYVTDSLSEASSTELWRLEVSTRDDRRVTHPQHIEMTSDTSDTMSLDGMNIHSNLQDTRSEDTDSEMSAMSISDTEMSYAPLAERIDTGQGPSEMRTSHNYTQTAN
ncbi:hypothetical protein FPOAC1_007312 [Fusarium poae]|uniref:hypothetical protein n=1 Tax=Fusarium poae TaxID=36050 RepID=UPI001CE95B6F|nr:hypothetical protein FPOAC1_007312 [Fusarium poae]KAG8673993.1 hypothetical protein FPOAC1_007312 [Fusarium poae]